jgi:hypothetical protein
VCLRCVYKSIAAVVAWDFAAGACQKVPWSPIALQTWGRRHAASDSGRARPCVQIFGAVMCRAILFQRPSQLCDGADDRAHCRHWQEQNLASLGTGVNSVLQTVQAAIWEMWRLG